MIEATVLNKLSTEQFQELHALDSKLVGTTKYLGIAYFWSGYYKHTMREATAEQRTKIHNMIISLGYKPSDRNNIIKSIIEEVTGQPVE